MLTLLAVVPLFVFPPTLSAANGRVQPRTVETAAAASIRVTVNMALVPVTVLDEDNRNATGLTPQNFRVIDGSDPQPIASFGQQDQPISVGLIFDCSNSMRDKYLVSRQAPSELFKRLGDGDEAFLITVSDDPVLRYGLTSNLEEMQNEMMFTSPHGATALVDGIYLGLKLLKTAHNPRKAPIAVSDGGDNNSR